MTMKIKDFIPAFTIAVLYFLFGHLSLINTVENSIVTISPFFSEGFALAFVLIFGKKVLPGIFLGQFLLAFTANYQILPSLIISISNTIEAYIGYYILIKLFKFDINLVKLRDIYLLVLTIVLVLQPFSASVGTLTLFLSSQLDKDKFEITFISWYFGNIIGQLLVTPAVLSFYSNYKKINYFKLIIITLFFAVLSYLVIIEANIQSLPLLSTITIIPLVILLSFRNGLIYTLMSVFVLAQVAIYTFQKHIGIFSIYSDMDNIININFYILSHIIIVLVMGSLILEKNLAVEKHKKLNSLLKEKVHQEVEKNREKDKIMFLQSRMAQMGETISMIAHQWRQPLNNLAIINQSLYIKHQKNRLTDEAFDKFFYSSKQQIENMTTTIDDFRSFFKPAKQKKNFSMNENILHLLDLIAPEFDRHNIYIHKDCRSEVYLKGYKNELLQALLNILNNAKDALVANRENSRQITISLYEIKNKKIILIKDNAGGISPENLNKIFDPYFSTKQKNGTGLGLYMTKVILEEHMGADIKFYNDDDGAVFEIVFTS